jgi:hypothetical protein
MVSRFQQNRSDSLMRGPMSREPRWVPAKRLAGLTLRRLPRQPSHRFDIRLHRFANCRFLGGMPISSSGIAEPVTRRAAAEPFGPTNGGLTGASRTDLLPAVVDRGVRPVHTFVNNLVVLNRRVAGTYIVAAVACIAFALLQFDRSPVPLSQLRQLHTMMTTNDVQSVLGSPSSAWTRTNDLGQSYSEWAFSRPMSWPIVYIHFTPDGRFASHRYDH